MRWKHFPKWSFSQIERFVYGILNKNFVYDTLNPVLCASICWTLRAHDPKFLNPQPPCFQIRLQIDATAGVGQQLLLLLLNEMVPRFWQISVILRIKWTSTTTVSFVDINFLSPRAVDSRTAPNFQISVCCMSIRCRTWWVFCMAATQFSSTPVTTCDHPFILYL